MIYDILIPQEVREVSNVITQLLNEKFAAEWGSGFTFRISNQDILNALEEIALVNDTLATKINADIPEIGFLNKDLIINCVNRYLEKEEKFLELKFNI